MLTFKNKLSLHITDIESFAEYIRHSDSLVGKYKDRKRCKAESALLTADASINTKGFCFICGRESAFHTDFLYSDPNDFMGDKRVPNWRERVVCSGCKLNNRIRGSIHFLENKLKARLHDRIYITEQTTPLYSYLQNKYCQLQGSEYLGDRVPLGEIDLSTGLRNESITKLTFEIDFFDFILSFDVFEHIPDYTLALAECLRCLRHGGTLLFTVPFNRFSEKNLVRAKVDENGDVEHILEPEFHGDPLNSEGCLCFYHFGWELLAQMRQLGFTRVTAHLFWSEKFGYLGGEQILFSAQK